MSEEDIMNQAESVAGQADRRLADRKEVSEEEWQLFLRAREAMAVLSSLADLEGIDDARLLAKRIDESGERAQIRVEIEAAVACLRLLYMSLKENA